MGDVHDEVKFRVLEFLRGQVRASGGDPDLVRPEWAVRSRDGRRLQVDIAFRNLALICEVEPSEAQKSTGFRQLCDYAAAAVGITERPLWGLLAWGASPAGDVWDVEVYRFETDGWPSGPPGRGPEAAAQVVPEALGFRIPLTARNFLDVTHPLLEHTRTLREILAAHIDDPAVAPLYQVYRNALEILYGGTAAGDRVQELMAVHTLLQMTALAVLRRDGRPIERTTGVGAPLPMSLPFLEWWYKLLEQALRPEEAEALDALAGEVTARVDAFDWENPQTDVFRLLYEAFIPPDARRTIGEYYTPPWLVRFVLDRLGPLADAVFVDPFCGSGTFLVYAFRQKLAEGVDPKTALRTTVGFDVNPLAVLLARAELITQYRAATGRLPEAAPPVFYVNSAEVLGHLPGRIFSTGGGRRLRPVFLYAVREFTRILRPGVLESLQRPDFGDLAEFEDVLAELLRGGFDERTIRRVIGSIREGLRRYLEALDPDEVRALLNQYGDAVWSVAISSLMAVRLVARLRGVVAASNPPWSHLTEIQGEYGRLIRRELVHRYFPHLPPQVYLAGDVSSLFLRGWSEAAERIAFVLPASASYDETTHNVGKLLTLDALGDRGDLYHIRYDAFDHGVFPTVAVGRTGSGRLYIVEVRGAPGRDAEQADLDCRPDARRLDAYRREIADYLQVSPKNLASRLNVAAVCTMGTYIRGLFGGERRRGRTPYAGLVVEKRHGRRIQLYGTESFIRLLPDEEEAYVRPIIYRGRVFPFFYTPLQCCVGNDTDDLKRFLRRLLTREMRVEDREKIRRLIEEVRISRPRVLRRGRWYVVYRSKRAFAAAALQGDGRTVPESSIALIEAKSEDAAWYMAAVLNYLVAKAMRLGVRFVRDQYGRPLLAAAELGLGWRDEDRQKEVAGRARQVAEVVARAGVFDDLSRGERVAEAFRWLETHSETAPLWREIVRLFDGLLETTRLRAALRHIGTPG